MANGLILLDMPLKKGLVYGSYFCLADEPEPGSVEPGFLAVIDENFIKHANENFKQNFTETEIEECKNYLKTCESEELELFATKLIDEEQKDIESSDQPALKLLLFKQDYSEPATPYNLYGFIKTPDTQKNSNTILECLANEIAGCYGMAVQKKYLVMGSYQTGAPKIMTACEWKKDLKDLEMLKDKIKGDSNSGNNENYVVQDDQNGNLVNDLGRCLALFISQGDNDVIGSLAQNKAQQGSHLFGFDFGHADRIKNPLIDSLKDDFTFNQPRAPFKNISICYDTLLSERMAGMFFIYKMMGKHLPKEFTSKIKKNIEAALQQYPKEVHEQYDKIGDLHDIFDEYHKKFNTLGYENYAKKIVEAKNRAIEANQAMLRIFIDRMQLSPAEVDLLDHLTKFSTETSTVSPDGTVALNHLRFIKKPTTHWSLSKKGDNYILKAEDSQARLSKLRIKISDFLDMKKSPLEPRTSDSDPFIEYALTSEQLKQWTKTFQEKNICDFTLKHPLDTAIEPQEDEDEELQKIIDIAAALKKQRQPLQAVDEQLSKIISRHVQSTLDELLTIEKSRKDYIETQKLQKETISPHNGNPMFAPAPSVKSTIGSTLNSTPKSNIEPQQYHLVLTLNNTPITAVLTNNSDSTHLSFDKKNKALDIASLWAESAPPEFKEKFSTEEERVSFFKDILERLRETDGDISKNGLTKALGNDEKLADILFTAYKRNTEQLDPIDPSQRINDPYDSHLYFPNDIFIRMAVNHVEQYVNTHGEAPHIILTKAWDPHYVEAVMLYCNLKRYNFTNHTDWKINSQEMHEKWVRFEYFFNERYEHLNTTPHQTPSL